MLQQLADKLGLATATILGQKCQQFANVFDVERVANIAALTRRMNEAGVVELFEMERR